MFAIDVIRLTVCSGQPSERAVPRYYCMAQNHVTQKNLRLLKGGF